MEQFIKSKIVQYKWMQFILLLILIISISAYIIWYFYYNIYETKTFIIPSKNIYYVDDEVTIKVSGINSFGKIIEIKSIESHFIFLEGKNLVDIKNLNTENGEINFIVKSK